MPPIKVKGSPCRIRSKGRDYWYAWRGGPRLFEPPGTDAFLRELADVRSVRANPDEGRLSSLVVKYRGSDEYAGLAQSTRDLWSPWLDKIRDHFGTLSIRHFDRPAIRVEIRRWHRARKDTPRAADTGLQVLSRVLSFGVAEGKLIQNMCDGVPHLHKSNRADVIWTQKDMDVLLSVASKEVKWVVRLAALTGMRREDLIKLSWSHVEQFGIEMRTGKSRGRQSVTIPITPELRTLLDQIPKKATTVLTSSHKKPWTGDGFGSSWWKTLKEAGLQGAGLRFHDFRGTAATNFYLAGFSEREIAQTLGWSEERVQRIIDRYVKRDEILKDRIRRLEAANNR